MQRITTPSGVTISYDMYGTGPPLVLVHGSFSDHNTNWQEAKPLLHDRFTVYAVARRGRGESSATQGHSVEDEAADIAAVLRAVGEPAFLLGHSYGAVCALNGAALAPDGVRKLVLYEPPHAHTASPEALEHMQAFVEREDWDGLVQVFLLEVMHLSRDEVDAMRADRAYWASWLADAEATLNDQRALVNHRFDAERYRLLGMPVLLLVGSESQRDLYVTDALAAVLPDVRIVALEGQAHEGVTTAPELFVDAVSEFLLA